METATFGGGCFWCTEAIFKRLKGVEKVVSGFSGGRIENPTTDDVYNKDTGHAEAVQVKFNPEVISYEKLLKIFFNLHNPTTLNQQDYDIGEQYRSVIFYHNETQKEIAKQVKAKTEEEKIYSNPIVTEIVPFSNFYTAEEYHQNFYEKSPDSGYCRIIINPKIKKLITLFNSDVKEEYK